MGRIIGYVRVSKVSQDENLQRDAMGALGIPSHLIFQDKVSGAKAQRPGLDACLEEIKTGDTLVVWPFDRLGRSLPHLVSLIADLKERGVGFRSIMDGAIDTTTPSGELIFNIFASLAHFERQIIRERTQAGLTAARARGRKGGRPPITADHPKVIMAKKMNEDKTLTVKQICTAIGISEATFYRYLSI